MYKSLLLPQKSFHVQGFRRLQKVLLIMALEDICEDLVVSSFKHFYTIIYKKLGLFYFTKIKVSTIYSVFLCDNHSYHTLKGMWAVQHILHCICIYKNMPHSKIFRYGKNNMHRYPSTVHKRKIIMFCNINLGWNAKET